MKKRVFVAGHQGMVGSAIVRALEKAGDAEIITRTRSELDLLDQAAVFRFFNQNAVDEVYLAAAKVGGIWANNTYPAEFIYQNLIIEANIIHGAFQAGVRKLLFLGSSCSYPKLAEQPIAESSLLQGALEPTNEPYAIAKIAGIKLCESYNRQYGTDYRSVMPTNLYGINDNFHPENSHVVPALLRRFHEAKMQDLPSVTVWGSGSPMREFLYVDDMAGACLHVMNLPKEVYGARAVGYRGDILWDTSKPDGTPRKLLDVSLLKRLGWQYSVELDEGIERTYQWFLQNQEKFRA